MISKIQQIEDATISHFLPLTVQFILIRLVSILSMSMYLGLPWFYRLDYNIVPVVGFEADANQFSFMNSASQFITFAFMMIGLLYSTRYVSRDNEALGEVIASMLGILMAVEMVVIGLYLNPYARFETQNRLVYGIFIASFISLIYSFYWIQKWRKLNRDLDNYLIVDESNRQSLLTKHRTV